MTDEHAMVDPLDHGPDEAPAEQAPLIRWRPASEPTCCGSLCDDCPF